MSPEVAVFGASVPSISAGFGCRGRASDSNLITNAPVTGETEMLSPTAPSISAGFGCRGRASDSNVITNAPVTGETEMLSPTLAGHGAVGYPVPELITVVA